MKKVLFGATAGLALVSYIAWGVTQENLKAERQAEREAKYEASICKPLNDSDFVEQVFLLAQRGRDARGNAAPEAVGAAQRMKRTVIDESTYSDKKQLETALDVIVTSMFALPQYVPDSKKAMATVLSSKVMLHCINYLNGNEATPVDLDNLVRTERLKTPKSPYRM